MTTDKQLDRVVAEMRKRFSSPAEVLMKLGIDAAILTAEQGMKPMRFRRAGAHDEGTPWTSETLLDALFEELEDLPVEEHRPFLEGLRSITAENDLGRSGEDRRRRARDEPEPFPGRPRAGGEPDPVKGGGDRRRLGADSAIRDGYADFVKSFPGARPGNGRLVY